MWFLHVHFSHHFCDAWYIYIYMRFYTFIFFTYLILNRIHFHMWCNWSHSHEVTCLLEFTYFNYSITYIIMGEKHLIICEMYVFFSGRNVSVCYCAWWQSSVKHFQISRCESWKCAMARATSCKTEQASNWHDLSWCEIGKTRKK